MSVAGGDATNFVALVELHVRKQQQWRRFLADNRTPCSTPAPTVEEVLLLSHVFVLAAAAPCHGHGRPHGLWRGSCVAVGGIFG